MIDNSQLVITPIAVPDSVDGADAAPYRAIAEIGTLVYRHDTGHRNFDHEPAEDLPSWQDQTDTRRLGFSATRDGVIVGVATIEVPLSEGARNVELEVLVRPDRWGEGVEHALLDVVEREAAALGRPVLQTYSLHRPDAGGARLAPPTGFGTIPADDRQTRFLLDRGYTLEQVERNSVFDLQGSFDTVERMFADASAIAGADYRVVTWTAPTPDEFKEGFGYAVSRMSTDVPTGDLEWAEEKWDVERVERRDQRLIAGGFTISVACAQHVPTGRIVAYNELVINGDPTEPTHQWGTLVLREHRGHRLGVLVKCANLLRWRTIAPLSPRVSTFNAEENRPMLDINEALGFIPASYAGGWKKVIAGSAGSSGSSGS